MKLDTYIIQEINALITEFKLPTQDFPELEVLGTGGGFEVYQLEFDTFTVWVTESSGQFKDYSENDYQVGIYKGTQSDINLFEEDDYLGGVTKDGFTHQDKLNAIDEYAQLCVGDMDIGPLMEIVKDKIVSSLTDDMAIDEAIKVIKESAYNYILEK